MSHAPSLKPSRSEFITMIQARWPDTEIAAIDRGLTILVGSARHLPLVSQLAGENGLTPKPVDTLTLRVFGFARLPRKGEP